MHRRSFSLVAGLLTLAGSGCSQTSSSLQPVPNSTSAASLQNHAAGSTGDVLYVPEFFVPAVNSYVGNPRKLVGSLNGTVTGVAVDATGDVWVSNFTNVALYTSETKTLIRTIDRNLYRPLIPVVAPDGTLDVMDKVGVAIFPDAQQTRMKRIEAKDAFAIAVDPQSNLYVAPNGQNSILVYPPNSATLSRTILDGIATPVAMAFDSAGNLYVANEAGGGRCGTEANAGTVTVYAPGASSPSYTITTAEGLCNPRALAFDPSGNLYVANSDDAKEFAGSVTVYSAGTATLLQTITDGIGTPESVAVDAAGKMYVANSAIKPSGGDVTVYAPGGGRLVQTISDGKRAAPLQVVIGK
jgi:hypothetical protein